MAKHSPGPWVVGRLDRHGQRMVESDWIEIATCWHHSVGSIEQEMEANARLIAASPKLLAALKAMVSAYGDKTWGTVYAMERALPDARAAIAAAEQEGVAP
jgi:hypothetical protein